MFWMFGVFYVCNDRYCLVRLENMEIDVRVHDDRATHFGTILLLHV